MFARDDYDVITIGGGPGGAAAATLVAKAGWRTLLVERSAEPRFKIGESLMPATYWPLERMGALEKMKRSHFVKKHSVQFFSKSGKASAPFYFQEVDPHESSVTWQVLRSEFDALLLDNAAEQGVEVRRGVAVRDVRRRRPSVADPGADRLACGRPPRLEGRYAGNGRTGRHGPAWRLSTCADCFRRIDVSLRNRAWDAPDPLRGPWSPAGIRRLYDSEADCRAAGCRQG
jgi:choline dehydrogenase-like flavoprotein